jgi:isoleucyl-tRNA synthetase
MYQSLVSSQDHSAPESVHLCSFAQADETLIDKELSEDMDAAADLVSRVLGLRKRRQIRVRQPLASVTVASRSETTSRALRRFEHHILDELNVKELVIADDESEIVGYSVKPDMSAMGPKFGKAAKAIATALESADAKEIAAKVDAGEGVSITASGKEYELTADDLIIETTCPDHIALHREENMTVALDTRLSDELIAEGIARDFVRHVQILRKERELELDDHIRLSYTTESRTLKGAIEEWLDYIKAETLAIEARDTIAGDPDKRIEICDERVALKIDKS